MSTRYSLATDISLAALTGDGVFNFGEVLSTPILHVLTNTPNEWLSAVLKAFDAGYDHGRERIVETEEGEEGDSELMPQRKGEDRRPSEPRGT